MLTGFICLLKKHIYLWNVFGQVKEEGLRKLKLNCKMSLDFYYDLMHLLSIFIYLLKVFFMYQL